MRRVVVFLLIAEIAIGAPAFLVAPRIARGPCVRVGGSLAIPPEVRCGGDALAVGGDLVIRGEVDGDAVALWGNVRVEGDVRGDVVSLGGGSSLLRGGSIAGNVTAVGGRFRQETGAALGGSALGTAWTLRGLRGGGDRLVVPLHQRVATGALAGAAGVGLGLLFALGLRTAWPRRIAVALAMVRRTWAESLGLGLATMLVLLGIVPLFSWFLLRLVVGIPLLVLLLLLAFLVCSVGMLLTGLAAGEAWSARLRKPAPVWLRSAAGLLLLAVAILVPAMWAPAWGMGIALVASAPGLGALLLSRAGTREAG
ncbi:MAG: hypothetical protein ACP5SI_06915 [Chloroflexia bacterium]